MNNLPLKTLLLGFALAGTITTAHAFPDRVVRLIVPFPPAGSRTWLLALLASSCRRSGDSRC